MRSFAAGNRALGVGSCGGVVVSNAARRNGDVRMYTPSDGERSTFAVQLRQHSSYFFDGNEQVLAKFLAPPGRLADLLAIAGDTSDGIVGAEGYGPVKAAKVWRHYRVRWCCTV